jgi:hypothetical protein
MNQTIRRFALMLIGLVAILPVAFGQVTTSSMSGRITDDEGPLAGATVIASYTPAGTQYYAVTDKSGNFNLLNVRAGGPYTIKVSMLGYRDYEVTGVNVALSDNYVLNIEMKQESIGLEAIVVSADALSSNMRSDRAGAITTADTRTIETLPTVSRSLNDVLRLTPQAVVTSNGLAVGGGTYRGFLCYRRRSRIQQCVRHRQQPACRRLAYFPRCIGSAFRKHHPLRRTPERIHGRFHPGRDEEWYQRIPYERL